MCQPIKLVSMNDQVAFAVSSAMHNPFDKAQRPEVQSKELLKEFVVITNDQGDFGLFAILAKQFLDEHVVLLRPVPLAPQLPAVNEIADDVKLLAFSRAQELQQLAHMGVPCTEMNV